MDVCGDGLVIFGFDLCFVVWYLIVVVVGDVEEVVDGVFL